MTNHQREDVPAADSRGRGQTGRFAKTLEGAERDAHAARLRAQGYSFARIARELGYADESGAYKSVSRALAAVPVEAVGELRALESARLDALLAALQSALEEGSVQAVDAARKLSESRRRLFGLDGPVDVKLSINDPRGAELRHLVDEAKARILGQRQGDDDV
ncbi:MAG TPA: hypothetical protein VGM10_04645 [Actinocrinis sp.]